MDKEAAKELEFQERLKKLLEDGKDAILMELQNEDEEKWIAEYNLLTSKPVIYAANVAEDDLADDGANNSYVQSVREYAKEHNSEVFVICAEIEAEISELEEDEKKMFLEDLGLTESGLEKLIAASYRLLGLMSFLTAGAMIGRFPLSRLPPQPTTVITRPLPSSTSWMLLSTFVNASGVWA